MKKKIHFGWFTEYGPIGWTDPNPKEGADWRHPEIYQEMAALCEQAGFDLAIFADHLGISSTYTNSLDFYIKHGLNGVCHDSTMLASMVAAKTNHLGVTSTISTTLTPPYLLARQLASLDHLTKGRVAWNVVTTANVAGFKNYGIDEMPEHDARYDQADEYMELCFKLWNSWEPDSVIMDRETGIFADPSKVKPIHFEGKYYKSAGPLNITPSPQGRPAIVQAGASNRGMDFAARWADAIIVAKQTVEDMKKYYDDIKGRVAKFGRNPDEMKVFFIIKPVIGETEEIAKQRAAEPPSEMAIHTALAAMSSRMSVDLSQFELDEPMPELGGPKVQGGQTTISRYQSAGRRPTLREIAAQEISGNKLNIVGTPVQVADQLAEIMETVGGDGFVVRVDNHNYHYLKEFVETVIPVLKDRDLVRREYKGSTLLENLMEF